MNKAIFRKRSDREILLFRKEFKEKIESFLTDSIKYGYVVACCGAGKTFTSFISTCNIYKPEDVIFVTSKHSIFTNLLASESSKKVIMKQKYGKDWLNIYSAETVNNINQPYFIYDTLASMHSKGVLINFLSEKKLLVFDESTYSGSAQFKSVALDIKNSLPELKILGCSLFDYRPMDEEDKDFMKNYFENCVCSYSLEELQSRGILPVVKVLKAYQSSNALFDSIKNNINPRTNKPYTLHDCRKLIKWHGLTTVDRDSFSDRLFRIFKRENWLNIKTINKCVHIMVVSSLVSVMEANTQYLIKFLKDTFSLIDDEIQVMYLASTKNYKSSNEESLKAFNNESDSKVKVKILSGVNMLNEGLHTEPEIDIMVNLSDTKAEYSVAQKCGRLHSQSFTHQPYFIDVACDEDTYEVMFGTSAHRGSGETSIKSYQSITGLSVDVFDLDDFNDLIGNNYMSTEEEYKLLDFIRRNAGVLYYPEDIVYRAYSEFSNISEEVINRKLIDLGVLK